MADSRRHPRDDVYRTAARHVAQKIRVAPFEARHYSDRWPLHCESGCGRVFYNRTCPAGFYMNGFGYQTHDMDVGYNYTIYCCRP